MDTIIGAAQATSVPGDVTQNLARHLRFAALAAEHGARLLVFPELSLTGYEPTLARRVAVSSDDVRLDALRRLAQDADMSIVVGAPILNEQQELLIAAFALLPDGQVSTYTKQHLHPGEEQVFARGSGGPTLSANGKTIALAICAEITRPEHAARAASQKADIYAAGVLITPAGYAADAALLERVALEHRMAVLMANHGGPTGGWVSAGKSAIWSQDGALVIASPGTEETLLLGQERGGAWTGVELPVRP